MSSNNIQEKPKNPVSKIILLGDARVGKSSYIHRYVNHTFSQTQYGLAMEFLEKVSQVDGRDLKVRIWDFSGAERFRIPTISYLRNTDGALILYSIDDRRSFEKVEYWFETLQKLLSNQMPTIVLIGQKCDLEAKRQVTKLEGANLALKLDIKFFECSSKEDINVKYSFDYLIEQVSKKENTSLAINTTPSEKLILPQQQQSFINKCYLL